MTIRKSGNTYIASGENVAGFGETPEIAEQHFLLLRDSDRRQHRNGQPHTSVFEVPGKQPSKDERSRQRRHHRKARRYQYGI